MNGTGIGIIFGALSAVVVAAPAGWFAYDIIAKPGIIREQQTICEATVRTAAAEAVAAEQLRRFRAGEAATEQFIKDSQAAADDAQAEHDLLELEIERYAQRVQDNGRVCALDADDLGLLGLHPEPGGTGGR